MNESFMDKRKNAIITVKFLGIRYLYESKLDKLSYFYSLDSDLKHKFIASSLKYIAIVFHISNVFLRKNVWKLFDFSWHSVYRCEEWIIFQNIFQTFCETLLKYYWDPPSGAPACSPLRNIFEKRLFLNQVVFVYIIVIFPQNPQKFWLTKYI